MSHARVLLQKLGHRGTHTPLCSYGFVIRTLTQPCGNSTRPCACRIQACREYTRACGNFTRACQNSDFQINTKIPDIHELKSHTGRVEIPHGRVEPRFLVYLKLISAILKAIFT
ncbi:hypothetical protein, partial [Bartonella sp. CL1QHWL]|uniref:hypothetical protein n=1 Tax=Bartonella sp. CL1QHWL TaxID=3243517 RepID=UPI0035CFB88B